ncbi:hypothetical protein L1987_65016 [Smallanthus sonchifolius]|uniref:Uncharacterized protein n=1 Tax=Smallanthus sonchifolius TaxID=185202 RepID=A0ACB9BTC3_9ASTR|nr:hypothetical protein L1987_65016 [Smallanthus sonchifolius]
MLQRAPQVILQARLLPRPIRYALQLFQHCYVWMLKCSEIMIHIKDSSVMLRAIALISSVWHLSSGLLLLLLLFIFVKHKTDVEDFEPVFHLYVWGTSIVMTVLRSIGNEHLVPCRFVSSSLKRLVLRSNIIEVTLWRDKADLIKRDGTTGKVVALTSLQMHKDSSVINLDLKFAIHPQEPC